MRAQRTFGWCRSASSYSVTIRCAIQNSCALNVLRCAYKSFPCGPSSRWTAAPIEIRGYTCHLEGVFGLGRRRLLDYLIRPQQQRRWDRQADSFRGLQVDDQLELGGLLDGQVAGLGTLQDAVNVPCGTPPLISDVRTVRHEAPVAVELPVNVYG